jgi:peptidylprolyl isomerase
MLAAVLGACGKSNPTPSGTQGASGGCDNATVTGEAGSKPNVTLNTNCDLPAKLVTKDIITGTGAEAKSGSSITVQYVGLGLKTKKEFDASWGRQPFPLSLGAGAVIKGWDQGIVGMKVGGRRLLVIPPDLGYGAQGFPPAIEANETLVFVVDLLDVK